MHVYGYSLTIELQSDDLYSPNGILAFALLRKKPEGRCMVRTYRLGVLAMTKRKKLRGSVKKVIKSPVPFEPEKAEIVIHEAEDLYKEIRIENVVTDEKGKKDKLKEGEEVDLIVETDPKENKQKP